MYGGDPSHTSYKPETLGTLSPQLKWNVTACPTTLTRCVVANGFVFVNCRAGNMIVIDDLGQVRKSIFFGGGSSVGPPNVNPTATNAYVEVNGVSQGLYIHSLDLSQDTVVWTATAGSQWPDYNYGMVENGESLFFPGGTYDGILYAVSLDTGEKLWESVSTGNCDSWTPTLHQNRLFWNSCSRFGEMSVSDGTVMWSVDLNPNWSGYSANWIPSISSKGFAYAISAASGVAVVVQVDLTLKRTTWGFPCAYRSGGVLAMAVDDEEGLGWISCTDGVKGIDLSIGFEKISLQCSDCSSEQPVVTKDYVIARSTSGTKIWKKSTGELVTTLPASGYLAYEKGWLYVVSGRNVVAYQLVQPQ